MVFFGASIMAILGRAEDAVVCQALDGLSFRVSIEFVLKRTPD
jgi:hypothetical protein